MKIFLLQVVLVVGMVPLISVSDAHAQSPAQSQPAEQKTVCEIQIVGSLEVDAGLIRGWIQNVKVNQPLALKDVQKDLDSLKLTGKFVDVYATTQPRDGKVVVIFHVVERQKIKTLQFVGAREIKAKDLLDLLAFKTGDPLDMLKVKSGAENLAQHYRKSGFNEASVELNEEALTEGNVEYCIIEGPRIRVTEIAFEGNSTFSDRCLQSKISTKTYMWILRPGTYSDDQVQEDIAELRKFYRTEGFLDAQVGRRIDYSEDRQKMAITFLVDEGIRYQVGAITMTGNKTFTTDDLLAAMSLVSGSILNLDRLEADRKAMTACYAGQGYIYARVDISYTFAETPGCVNLNVTVIEGDSYNIGRITIRGNKKTQDRVVRRTLDFYPTQVFDLNKMQERERRLRETRLFRDVQIRPVPGETAEERDVLIQVEEADTTRVMAGVGVTSNSGVIGTLSIENWNFNFFDPPRTMGEFFRGQAFKGAGQTLKLSFEPGTEMTSFRIDFREPYLRDMPLAFGWSAYLFERDRDGYDEERFGTVFSFDKRFKDIYSGGVAFRIENIDISNVEKHFLFFAPKDVLEAEGSNFLTSIKLSASRDTTDSFLMPSKGTRLEASWEQAVGDFSFAKLIGQATRYKTLRTDIYDRKTVWASNMTVGYIAGDAPIFERFYGGGIGSIRGFEYRGVSPRQWPSSTAVGGNSELLVGNEVSFPLVGKTLRGVTFLDMGSVDDDFAVQTWRATVGFGLRLTLDFFGPVPMAFDFGIPLIEDDEDDTQVFSFSLGATFK
jgi:outer membrane protein insertion porin family